MVFTGLVYLFVALQSLKGRMKSLLIMVEGGHELLQEKKTIIIMISSSLLMRGHLKLLNIDLYQEERFLHVVVGSVLNGSHGVLLLEL